MTAKLLRHVVRPAKKLTRRRGNHQILPNGNSFVCWSDNAHISEHASDGRVVMEAQFQSSRFTTYRAYKSSFVGSPKGPPAVKAFVFGVCPKRSTTVVYVSWNGATEVAHWELYSKGNGGEMRYVDQVNKTSFEDVIQGHGCHEEIVVQAYDTRGQMIGRSPWVKAQFPRSWESKRCVRSRWAVLDRDGGCGTFCSAHCFTYYFEHPAGWPLMAVLSSVLILAGVARGRSYRRLRRCLGCARGAK